MSAARNRRRRATAKAIKASKVRRDVNPTVTEVLREGDNPLDGRRPITEKPIARVRIRDPVCREFVWFARDGA